MSHVLFKPENVINTNMMIIQYLSVVTVSEMYVFVTQIGTLLMSLHVCSYLSEFNNNFVFAKGDFLCL
jgi:hypothetical protein